MGRGFGSYIRVADKAFVMEVKKCMYCGSEDNLSIDHIIPLNKGGDSRRSNLTRSCNRCNGLKTNFLIGDFLERCIIKKKYHFDRLVKFDKKVERLKKYDPYNEIENAQSKRVKEGYEYIYFSRIINSIKSKRYIING